MTVDYHYHFNRCMKNPSFISEDYCVTVSITINTTILSITTRLLFAHFFNLHVYIFYISVQLTVAWLFVFIIKLNWTALIEVHMLLLLGYIAVGTVYMHAAYCYRQSGVACRFVLSVTLWVLQKRRNRLNCRLGYGLGWGERTMC